MSRSDGRWPMSAGVVRGARAPADEAVRRGGGGSRGGWVSEWVWVWVCLWVGRGWRRETALLLTASVRDRLTTTDHNRP